MFVNPETLTYCISTLPINLNVSMDIVFGRFNESTGLLLTISFVILVKYSIPFNDETYGAWQVTVSIVIVPLKFFTSLFVMSLSLPVLSNAFGHTLFLRYTLNMLSGMNFMVAVSPGVPPGSGATSTFFEQD